jgi:hypothetical protein
MTTHEKRHLIRALHAYRQGEGHRGDYQLWVGFGDDWTLFKAKLIRDGYLNDAKRSDSMLTDRGNGLLARFEPAAA